MKSKYRPRYAKQLLAGMKDENGRPLSVLRCCRVWNITVVTYNAWKEAHPKFAHAAEMAKMERAIWWEDLNADIAEGKVKGNAGLTQFALKNIEGINWAEKVEVNNHFDEAVKTINIKMLPQSDIHVIEHIPENLLEDDSLSGSGSDEESD